MAKTGLPVTRPSKKRLSLRATAKQLGITHPALIKAVRDGRVAQGKDGRFDADQARKQLAANSHPKKRSKQATTAGEREPEPDDKDSIAEAARLLEWEKLRKARIANEERLNLLVPLAPVNAWVAGMILRAKEVLFRIPKKLRDRIAQTTDPVACEQMLLDEVNKAVSELAEYKP